MVETPVVVPFHCYSAGDAFALQFADGRYFEATQWGRRDTAVFETQARAQEFIDDREFIEVEVLKLRDVLAAAGWVQALGYYDANCDRLVAYCEAQGIHFYAADRENFSRYAAIRQAQRLGLTKLVMEDLS